MTNSVKPINIRDFTFKDSTPQNTVNTIKSILQKNNITTEEKWLESGVPYCYTVQIHIVDSMFYSTGKGLTEDLALASGYGELIERFQMGFVGGPNAHKDGEKSIIDKSSELIPAYDLFNKNKNWYELISKYYYQTLGKDFPASAIIKQHTDSNGMVKCTKYYCLTQNSDEYLPSHMTRRLYTTNGCAAGNSPEETIVQAISEIMERHNQFYAITRGISLPDIPEDILKEFKISYKIIDYLRSKGLTVKIKDCSLGTSFPVVCAIIIDNKTGQYHSHFGAYPILEIAIERSLTESFQGRNLENIAEFSEFLFTDKQKYSSSSIINEYLYGSWHKAPNFFNSSSALKYNKSVGFKGKNNKELLSECINFFKQDGYDILVKDFSSLGFYTYQIIIPGFSEALLHRLDIQNDDHRYAQIASKVLRNPSAAKIDEYLAFLMHIDKIKIFPENAVGIHDYLSIAKITAKINNKDNHRLMASSLAYIYYQLGNYKLAIKNISALLSNKEIEDAAYLNALKQYLSLIMNGYSVDDSLQILKALHQENTTKKIKHYIENKLNPLEDYILKCDMGSCENCALATTCYQIKTKSISDIIENKINSLDYNVFKSTLQLSIE